MTSSTGRAWSMTKMMMATKLYMKTIGPIRACRVNAERVEGL